MYVLIGLETLQIPGNKYTMVYSNNQKHSPARSWSVSSGLYHGHYSALVCIVETQLIQMILL